MSFTSYSVENDKEFNARLKKAARQVGDLTIPLTLISKDFYRSEKSIFQLKSPGQYPDLADTTKEQKRKAVGFVYPILKRTGRLADSLTKPSSRDAINKIVNKTTLFIGTKVPYGIFHQSDATRTKIPLRKFLFIGPEAKRFATNDQVGRPKRWLSIIDGFVEEKLVQLGKVK